MRTINGLRRFWENRGDEEQFAIILGGASTVCGFGSAALTRAAIPPIRRVPTPVLGFFMSAVWLPVLFIGFIMMILHDSGNSSDMSNF